MGGPLMGDWLLLVFSDEFVTDAGDGEEELRALGIFLEFFAQAEEVGVDGAGKDVGIVSPDGSEELAARDGASGSFHEVAEQLELARGEVDGLAVASDLGVANVHAKRAEVVNALAAVHGGAPQENFDAGQKLRSFEWFGHVVVGSELEANDLVDGLVADGEDHDGGGHSGGAEIAAYIEAAASGQHEIHDDEIEWIGGGFIESFVAVGGGVDDVFFRTQAVAQSGTERLFILDQEYAFIHFDHLRCGIG